MPPPHCLVTGMPFAGKTLFSRRASELSVPPTTDKSPPPPPTSTQWQVVGASDVPAALHGAFYSSESLVFLLFDLPTMAYDPDTAVRHLRLWLDSMGDTIDVVSTCVRVVLVGTKADLLDTNTSVQSLLGAAEDVFFSRITDWGDARRDALAARRKRRFAVASPSTTDATHTEIDGDRLTPSLDSSDGRSESPVSLVSTESDGSDDTVVGGEPPPPVTPASRSPVKLVACGAVSIATDTVELFPPSASVSTIESFLQHVWTVAPRYASSPPIPATPTPAPPPPPPLFVATPPPPAVPTYFPAWEVLAAGNALRPPVVPIPRTAPPVGVLPPDYDPTTQTWSMHCRYLLPRLPVCVLTSLVAALSTDRHEDTVQRGLSFLLHTPSSPERVAVWVEPVPKDVDVDEEASVVDDASPTTDFSDPLSVLLSLSQGGHIHVAAWYDECPSDLLPTLCNGFGPPFEDWLPWTELTWARRTVARVLDDHHVRAVPTQFLVGDTWVDHAVIQARVPHFNWDKIIMPFGGKAYLPSHFIPLTALGSVVSTHVTGRPAGRYVCPVCQTHRTLTADCTRPPPPNEWQIDPATLSRFRRVETPPGALSATLDGQSVLLRVVDDARVLTGHRVARRLGGVSVVMVYGVCVQPQPERRQWVVTERMDGGTLTDWVASRRRRVELMAGDAREIVRQSLALLRDVCVGVQHVHSHGYLHLDLSLGSVLVASSTDAHTTERTTAKLDGFGHAVEIDRTSGTAVVSTQYGRLGYQCGEMVECGDGGGVSVSLQPASDMYSFGVVAMCVMAMHPSPSVVWAVTHPLDVAFAAAARSGRVPDWDRCCPDVVKTEWAALKSVLSVVGRCFSRDMGTRPTPGDVVSVMEAALADLQ